MARIQVYFDGDCPICAREMDRCRVLEGAAAIDFVDINKDMSALQSNGVRYEEALARLYVRDETGRLHKGISAYAVLFKKLRRYRWLARLVTLPGALPVLDRIYAAWASGRRRNPSQHIAER
jgi:predicted DCC family thiol-disulfide oxidoreductase YuxK